ncbi:endonuclease [Alphaproteobacteria bacterium]|nr:endonuclease [Alphaproteobacteria bacterium]
METFYQSKIILRDIFQNNQYTFYCSCSYEHKKPIFKGCGYKPYKNFKRANRIEWEHIVPASRFGKKFKSWTHGNLKCIKNGKRFKGRNCARKISKKFRLIEADLYNLHPTIGEINQQRQNFKMSIIPGEKRNYGKCDFEVQNKFVEPSPNIRGDIARTYFYMADTYSNYITLTKSELSLFSKWNNIDPVNEWECKKSKLIENSQKNINKFIVQGCKASD